ncbi:MAG TPA: thioredoxin domain-containing protein [Devosiaceae bacterium]|jgi:protein-disulfide isomerase|nr:thioredoxin domain-containing protein [Devosiaceae bacterium]
MNRRLVVVLTAVVAVAVFAAGAWLYQRQALQPAADPAVAALESKGFIRAKSPIIGNPDAPVTIIEFFDPACEACRAFYPYVKDILAQNEGNVRLVLRYAPFHGEMSHAAVALLEAARKQNRFEPVLDIVMARQPEWARHGAPALDRLWELAATAGLNVEQARSDSIDPAIAQLVEQDMTDLQTHKVRGTPTFFVNGRPLLNFSPDGLAALVADELQRNTTAVQP